MNYKAQEHRFIYPGSQAQGHIFAAGADKGFCKVKKEIILLKRERLEIGTGYAH